MLIRLFRNVLALSLLGITPPATPAAAESGEQLLFQYRHVQLVRHTDLITGNRRCWIQAMFRATPAERYVFAIGFLGEGRFTFFVRFPDQASWLDSQGHALWLADGSGYPLERLELTTGEALTTAKPDSRDAIVRTLMTNGEFSLMYHRLDGVRRSEATFTGLRQVAEKAAVDCKDARLVKLP